MNRRRNRYHSSRRKSRLRVKRLILYVVCLMLVVIGIVAAIKMVQNIRDNRERERQEAAQLLEMQAQVDGYDDVFAENIYLDGEKLTGKSYDEVMADFTARYESRLQNNIIISFNGGTWDFSAALVGGSTDVRERVDEAWSYMREGDMFARYEELERLKSQPVYLNVSLQYDSDALLAFAQELKAAVDMPPTDATMTIEGEGDAKITDSICGYSLNLEETERQLVRAVEQGITENIELLPEIIEPEVTEDELSDSYVLLAKFATYFRGSSNDRSYNIKLALSFFNGLEVEAGQTVSFNDVVGPRTESRGFRRANEYVDGQVAVGVGGGTCQASTTLYGAILRAGLKIVQRQAHSLPVSYVDPSQDATVSSTGVDLVFSNNTGSTIYIYTSISKEKSRAMVTIYGAQPKRKVDIRIESEILQADIAASPKYIKDTDGEYVWFADEAPVQKSAGVLGYRSRAYRVYYDADTGEELKRELLSTDYYAPTPAEYYVGVH